MDPRGRRWVALKHIRGTSMEAIYRSVRNPMGERWIGYVTGRAIAAQKLRRSFSAMEVLC
jgi:hypothetical protein